jgi:hypothetical protein
VTPIFGQGVSPGLRLTESITEPAIKRLPPTGAIDQFTDSTDALNDLPRR